MKLLLSWLREFVDVSGEVGRLADDLTSAGLAVDAVESVGSDHVLDLDITTNRVDCMNVYGVAREVSVLYRVPLRPLNLAFTDSGPRSSDALAVEIEAPDLCPRFCARILDVRMGPSPAWVRDRLEAVGVRSINNVVDLTNYVMLEMGQPTHAFDLARIPDGRLRVRWAVEGEGLRTLDGVERRLTGRMGVVAGPKVALALAGVMGGSSSEVSDETRAVALEAAYWEPLAIRRTSKALGMHTEASHRFERGADPEAPAAATARIAHLLEKTGAGSTRPGLIDSHPAPRPPRKVLLRPGRLQALLGVTIAAEESGRILTGLGFGVGPPEAMGTEVTVPTWRGDVSREVDVIEEVGRHHGLDKVPSRLPSNSVGGGLKAWQSREREVRGTLVGAGLTEVIQSAFVSEAESGDLPGSRVALENPLSEEQSVLRNSLVVPGLLGALRTNLRQGRRDLGLFELGRVFSRAEGLPMEERRLGVVLTGSARPGHWSEKPRPSDFFDGKGMVEAVLRRLGVPDADWQGDGAPSFLHPGRSAALRHRGATLGYLGVVHPAVAQRFELRDETVAAEIQIEGLLLEVGPPARFRALERFPPVTRDVSVLTVADRPARDLQASIREAAGALLRSVGVVDRYDRPPVPPGKVSLTLNLVFQHSDRTLTGDEIQDAMARVVGALRSGGAEIRGE